MIKVLHITESFGGGVTSAINSYVKHSQQFEHFLFACTRPGDATGEEHQGYLKQIKLVRRTFSIPLQLKRYIAEVKPDAIHLHSTYAGALCRLMPFIDARKVIYTPHGFAFLRDDHPWVLKLYYWVENVLARRTAIIAGCGRDEQRIAGRLIKQSKTFELINVCDDLPEVTVQQGPEDSRTVVGMVGRITAQKGYSYFQDLAVRCGDTIRFKWIGGGDPQAIAGLKAAGVEVTGWLTRPEVISHMKGLDLYFHSAAWDGFPISVLEASKLGLPILLRDIGPFSSEDLHTVSSIEQARDDILAFAERAQSVCRRARENTLNVQKYHSTHKLQSALSQLYSAFSKHYSAA
ncbi:MAG: glycosyltransferase [Pseudomonas sp.]|nr:glycosyltransferase [Pseudomonas sp.]